MSVTREAGHPPHERREYDEVEQIRQVGERWKTRTELAEDAVGTWTFRLARREKYRTGDGRLTDAFLEEAKGSPTSEGSIIQGYGRITNELESLASEFASSCMYVCLVNKEKKLIGLAHTHTTVDIGGFLDEWLKLAKAKDTIVYLVKGNGIGEKDTATDMIKFTKDELSGREFKVSYEDFEKPVAGEPRGDNVTNITLKNDGRADVTRYHTLKGGIRGDKTVYEIYENKVTVHN
ncbi:MAG: hypothetical protein V1921_03520 [Candidatus Altiarchaeota archaeon]